MMIHQLRHFFLGTLLWMASLLSCPSVVCAQSEPAPPRRRAKLPTFDRSVTSQIFFDDVFSKLVGPRPAVSSAAYTPADAPPTSPVAGPDRSWMKIISSTTLEDEVKSIVLAIPPYVKTPSEFASRGHRSVRREFSVLAMLMAIVSDYEGDVRWKRQAAALRDALARAAAHTQAGASREGYHEARRRAADLQDLVRGESLSLPAGSSQTDWGRIGDRPALMQRLEIASQQRLSAATADPREFEAQKERIRHEAELIAAIAEVLMQDGLEDAGDEDYASYARQMQRAALEMVASGQKGSARSVRDALGKLQKACMDCHESYR